MTPASPAGSPPRLAEWLVGRAAPNSRWGDMTAGDLREEFAARLDRDGRRPARIWYWRQTALLLLEAGARLSRRAAGPFISLVRPQGDGIVRTLLRETRFAWRALIRQPLVSAIVILTLALGLGANAATFGWIDGLLLHPFKIAGVDRLVVLSENAAADPFPRESVSAANFLDLKSEAGVFDRMAAFSWWDVNLAGSHAPERVQGSQVSGEFFATLGATPAHGRLIDDRDDSPGEQRQAVISDGLWTRRFGRDASVVGRTIQLDGLPYTVVGVAAPGFDFPNGTEIWAPLAFTPEQAGNRTRRYLTVAARLKRDVTFEQAQAQMRIVYQRLSEKHVDANRTRHMVVRTFTDGMVDVGMPQVLGLWQAAAILVLLIGCTNVANLLLARGAARQRELAIRLAIGADRWRLVRQLLIESVVLALTATPFALGVAALAFQLVQAAMPAELVRFVPGWTDMGINGTIILFTAGTAVITSVIFGLVPALQISKPMLTTALRDGGRSVTGSATRGRLRRGLVIAEIALALPLLVASGLAAIGAQRFASGPQGYDPDGVLRMRMVLPASTYADAAAHRRFAERLVEEARKLPGVEQAATTSTLPASGSNQERYLTVDGRPIDPDNPLFVSFRAVSPGYLSLLRVPVLQGRGVEPFDRSDTERVAVVSRSMAERYWPGRTAIGQRIRLGRDSQDWITVVGVSGDTIDDWFNRRQAPTVYAPVAQLPSGSVCLVLRTSGDPAGLAGAARQAVAAVDPAQPAFDVMTMRDALRVRTTGLRFIGALMTAFGLLALVLSTVGIYSVMAFHVAQRRHEMGIRMALGASTRDVLGLTIRHGARMSGVGILIGLGLGLALARIMENALFGIVALELWLFATIAAVLTLVALAASLIPARQAARVDPVIALKSDC